MPLIHSAPADAFERLAGSRARDHDRTSHMALAIWTHGDGFCRRVLRELDAIERMAQEETREHYATGERIAP